MTDNNRPKERRLHPRYGVEGTIDLGIGKEGAAVLRDISMSGLACTSPVAFDEMSILEITMTLPHPEGGRAFKAGGAVVRSAPDDEPGQFLVAIFFTHMDDANKQILREFITTRGESSEA